MLDKILKSGQKKLEEMYQAQAEQREERDQAWERKFKRLVPPAVRQYARVDKAETAADIIIRLPKSHFEVRRDLSFTGSAWVDNGLGYWNVMAGEESIDAFESLDMALARSLEGT